MSFQGYLGRDYAMAHVHVIKNGRTISTEQVGTTGTSDTFWSDGKATTRA
jgi:hypothetical protein